MKKCVILVFLLLLLLLVVVCSSAEQKHFKGYGVETWIDGDILTIKTDSGEFSVIILPKKFTREESFAFHCWQSVLCVHLSHDMEINDKIKAVEEIQYFIEILAARIKTGKMEIKLEDVLIDTQDIREALKMFWQMSFLAADRLVGNEDGFCSDAEIDKLKMSLQSRVVAVITKTYFK